MEAKVKSRLKRLSKLEKKMEDKLSKYKIKEEAVSKGKCDLSKELSKMESEVNFDLLNDMRVNYENLYEKMKTEQEEYLKRRAEAKRQRKEAKKAKKPKKEFKEGFTQTFVDQKTVLTGEQLMGKIEVQQNKLKASEEVENLTKSLLISNCARLSLNMHSVETQEKALNNKIMDQYSIKDVHILEKLLDSFTESLFLHWDDLVSALTEDILEEELTRFLLQENKSQAADKIQRVKVLLETDMDTEFNKITNVVRLKRAFEEVKHEEDAIFAKYNIS